MKIEIVTAWDDIPCLCGAKLVRGQTIHAVSRTRIRAGVATFRCDRCIAPILAAERKLALLPEPMRSNLQKQAHTLEDDAGASLGVAIESRRKIIENA